MVSNDEQFSPGFARSLCRCLYLVEMSACSQVPLVSGTVSLLGGDDNDDDNDDDDDDDDDDNDDNDDDDDDDDDDNDDGDDDDDDNDAWGRPSFGPEEIGELWEVGWVVHI